MESLKSNPYPNRPYPVGQLEYPLTPDRAAKIADLSKLCMLEFGEQEVMFDMPRIVGMDGVYVNLGHAMGGSALLLARGIQDQMLPYSYVVSVDTFTYFKHQLRQASETIATLGLEHFIKLREGTTSEAVRDFWEDKQQIVFAFIDADHSYEGVREDSLNYCPLIKVGGVVAFHDTNQEPSHRVIEALTIEPSCWKQILHVNRIKAFRRV